MQIIIDGKEAVLKKGSSFDFIAENRLFSGSDSYTLSITFPLRDCQQNIDLFGYLHRSELPIDDYVFDCEIRDGAFSRFGTLTIVEISDIDVKAQFLEGRAEQNFAKNFDEIYINELDLGPFPSYKPSELSPEQAWDPATTNFQAVALPWVSADGGVHHNFADFDASTNKYSWCSDVQDLTWLPYLIYIAKKICEAVEYDYDFSEWENDAFLKYMLVCNALPGTWDLNGYSYMLPHWTVDEFFEKLELFLRGEFSIDHRAKEISFRFSKNMLETTPPVSLESVVDDFSASVKEDGSDCNFIDSKNIAYKESSHQMSPFYSCDWFVEQYKDKSISERLYSYPHISDMIEAQKNSLFVSDYLKNNGSQSGGGNHRPPGSTSSSGLYKIDLLYVEDIDMFFIRRLVSYEKDETNSKKNYTYYNSRYILQPLNEFGKREKNKDSDDCEEIEFVPACIDYTEEKYGFCLFSNFSSFSESSTDNDSTFLEVSGNEINWAIPYGGKRSVQKMIEKGKQDGRSEYYDMIYIGYYWQHNKYGPLPIPQPSSISINSDGVPDGVYGESLRLNDTSNPRWHSFYNIDRTRKVTFKFLSDDIPNPRAVFYIRGRRYICEKITATFSEDGMSQLLKGEFWPLLDD